MSTLELRFLAVLVDAKGTICETLYDDNDLDCAQLQDIQQMYGDDDQ